MSFEMFSNYRFGFSMLDYKMPEEKSQIQYYDRWMKKYAELFENGNEKAVEWEVRCQKSVREIFTSANFFIEAKKNLEMI